MSDRDIRAELSAQRIRLEPCDLTLIQPASIDVRLDRWFRLFDNHRYPAIDPSLEQSELTRLIDVGADEPFILHPGEFVLGATYERVTLPNDIAARLEGKSSLGRLGLLTHSTAGFIDPGFTGHVTLELSNTATMPIKLWPGMKVGQLCFFRLSSPAAAPYGAGAPGSRYQGQRGPTASRSYLGFQRLRIADVTLATAGAPASAAASLAGTDAVADADAVRTPSVSQAAASAFAPAPAAAASGAPTDPTARAGEHE